MASMLERIVVPSNREVLRDVTQRTLAATTTSAALMKAYQIAHAGTYRFKITWNNGGGILQIVQIYRNGVAWGTYNEASTTATSTFVEDIGGWKAGDTAQLYVHCVSGGGGTGTLYLFSMSGDYDLRPPAVPKGRTITDTNV